MVSITPLTNFLNDTQSIQPSNNYSTVLPVTNNTSNFNSPNQQANSNILNQNLQIPKWVRFVMLIASLSIFVDFVMGMSFRHNEYSTGKKVDRYLFNKFKEIEPHEQNHKLEKETLKLTVSESYAQLLREVVPDPKQFTKGIFNWKFDQKAYEAELARRLDQHFSRNTSLAKQLLKEAREMK